MFFNIYNEINTNIFEYIRIYILSSTECTYIYIYIYIYIIIIWDIIY